MKLTKALCCALTGLLVPVFFTGCIGGEGGGNIPDGPLDDGDLVFDDGGEIVYENAEAKIR